MQEKVFYIYIMTNKNNTVLYIGVTSNLQKRIFEHKNKFVSGFTNKYNIEKLVYYEMCEEALPAFEREKKLKRWKRKWKEDLINEKNPDWKDLYDELN